MTTPQTFAITPNPDFCQNNPTLIQQTNALAESYESGKEVIEDTRLQAIGSNLWDTLEISEAFAAKKKQLGLAGTLAIIIESDQGDILNLPWEALYHPEHGFLARESGFSLTRRMPKVQTGLPAVTCEPLRILLFTSLPDNLSEQGRLDIEAEQAAVQEALNVAELEGRIELEMPDDGRLESFQETLHRFQPHLVWMSGHGEFKHDLINDKACGSFVFEDQWGDATPVSEQDLARCFAGVPSVQAVILSACQSAKPHPAHPDNGLAQTLHNAGIPHVIGMRESVFDKAATRFAQAFLAELVHDKQNQRIDQALQKAQCGDDARELLSRMRAYQQPVDMDGIRSIALPELKQVERQVEGLLAVSLLERYEHPTLGMEYQISPLVRDWLGQQVGVEGVDTSYKQIAARYMLEQLQTKQKQNWKHKIHTHQSLIDSGLNEIGHQLVLNWIVGRLSNAGRYQELINEWLPPILESDKELLYGEALDSIGKQHLHIGNYDTALNYLKQSLIIRQEIGDKSGEGTTLNNISQIYDFKGDYDTALNYLQQSLVLQQEIGDKSGEDVALNNISQIYAARGDSDTALKYLNQALAIQQKIDNRHGEGATLTNISAIYNAKGDSDTALKYLKQSLQIQRKIGDKYGGSATLNNISAIHNDKGDYDTALKYLKQSLAIAQEIGDSASLCTTLFNMGFIHAQNDEIPEAMSTWLTAYQLAKEMNLAQLLEALGNLAPQLGLGGGLAGWERLAQQHKVD